MNSVAPLRNARVPEQPDPRAAGLAGTARHSNGPRSPRSPRSIWGRSTCPCSIALRLTLSAKSLFFEPPAARGLLHQLVPVTRDRGQSGWPEIRRCASRATRTVVQGASAMTLCDNRAANQTQHWANRHDKHCRARAPRARACPTSPIEPPSHLDEGLLRQTAATSSRSQVRR